MRRVLDLRKVLPRCPAAGGGDPNYIRCNGCEGIHNFRLDIDVEKWESLRQPNGHRFLGCFGYLKQYIHVSIYILPHGCLLGFTLSSMPIWLTQRFPLLDVDV